MKCKTNKSCEGFFPELIFNDLSYISSDKRIANLLDLEYKEYVNFIAQNGGFLIGKNYYFENQEECQKFIENFIEPRLVIQKLTR